MVSKNRAVLALAIVIALAASIAIYIANTATLQHKEFEPMKPVEVKALTLPELVNASNSFALNLYGLVLRDNRSSNVVVSSLNIYVALLMLYEGANTSTRDEIGNALGIPGADACNAYRELLSKLPIREGNSTVLYIANAVWLKKHFPFRQEYVDRIRSCFNGDVNSFESVDELVDSVNRWVEEKTRGLIKRVLGKESLDESTVTVIVSAIYFKAQWLIEFMPSGEMDFWTENGAVRVPAMSVEGEHITVALDNDYTAVEIPYNGTSIVMDIIMPRNFSNAIPRYRELILKALKSLDSKKDPTFARLVMPKFNITYSTNLNNYLKELGVRKAFILGEADFSRMTPATVAVDKVLHKAVIKVNEKGAEAAAVTAIIIATSAPAYQLEIVLNRPFIFILRDKASGTILFIGHVVNPLQQGEA